MSGEEGLVWRRSSDCDAGTCLEVAARADQVFIRDSAHRDGPRLACSRSAWETFLAAVRTGEFDRP